MKFLFIILLIFIISVQTYHKKYQKYQHLKHRYAKKHKLPRLPFSLLKAQDRIYPADIDESVLDKKRSSMDYKIFNKNYKYPQAKMDPVPYYDPSQKDVDVKWESGPLFVHDTQKIKDTHYDKHQNIKKAGLLTEQKPAINHKDQGAYYDPIPGPEEGIFDHHYNHDDLNAYELPSAFESESDIFAVPITEAVDYETEEKEKIEHTNRLLVKQKIYYDPTRRYDPQTKPDLIQEALKQREEDDSTPNTITLEELNKEEKRINQEIDKILNREEAPYSKSRPDIMFDKKNRAKIDRENYKEENYNIIHRPLGERYYDSTNESDVNHTTNKKSRK